MSPTFRHHASIGPSRLVLYVEDHPVNVLLMQAIFERRPNYRLVVATDGAAAWRMSGTLKPDLLLLDIGLPDCTGTDLLKRLRTLRDWPLVPAVAVTADRCFDIDGSSCCECWHKPLRVEQVLAGLDRYLGPIEDGSGRTAVPMRIDRGLPSIASV